MLLSALTISGSGSGVYYRDIAIQQTSATVIATQ